MIVLGSRKFSRYELFSLTMTSLCKAIGRPNIIITGNMKGIDNFAQQWAYNNTIKYEVRTDLISVLSNSSRPSMVLITFSNEKSVWLRNVEKKANKLGIRHFDMPIKTYI